MQDLEDADYDIDDAWKSFLEDGTIENNISESNPQEISD